ncbi:hypothetical protein [Singulisphaera acidiphila]|uniref:hypothetical protein n=1 Tax=Singulisphaera acidiphila TaxID=466153 RepID=UPI0003807F1A|nr:hypothetical protein [Singulisphaera acidiphila]
MMAGQPSARVVVGDRATVFSRDAVLIITKESSLLDLVRFNGEKGGRPRATICWRLLRKSKILTLNNAFMIFDMISLLGIALSAFSRWPIKAIHFMLLKIY